MNASRWTVVCVACGLGISAAHAQVKLHNKDTKAHDITVKCKSTVSRSIQPGTIVTLGHGPCTVTLKASDVSMSGSGDTTLVIPKAKK